MHSLGTSKNIKDVTVTQTAVLCHCRDVILEPDHDAGGCNICGRPDFALGTFCDCTMVLCDQCECEFHVGCLRKANCCDLSQLPTGDSSILNSCQLPLTVDNVLATLPTCNVWSSKGLAWQLDAV